MLASAATGIQVGAAIVATRYVIDQTGPASLALLRYAIGFCCLLPPMLVLSPRPRFERRDLAAVAALGIGQFGILIALLNYGLRFVTSARAALVFATFPLLTLIVAATLGRERLTAAKIGGVLVTVAGVAIALGERAGDRGGGAWIGELAVLGSAFVGAICSVLYRPYVVKYHPVLVSAFAMLASVAFLAVFAAGEGFFAAPPSFTGLGWSAVVFIGLSSGVGYFLWLWALAHATPTRVTVFLSLSPLTAAALGASFLGEPLSARLGVGLAAVIVGLALAHLRTDAASRVSRVRAT